MCHNETINIWTHLIMSLFCVFLIFKTDSYFDNAYNLLNLEQKWHLNRINISNEIEEKLPYLYNERYIF